MINTSQVVICKNSSAEYYVIILIIYLAKFVEIIFIMVITRTYKYDSSYYLAIEKTITSPKCGQIKDTMAFAPNTCHS